MEESIFAEVNAAIQLNVAAGECRGKSQTGLILRSESHAVCMGGKSAGAARSSREFFPHHLPV